MRLDVRIYKKHDADIAALSYAGYSVTNMIKDALDALVENRPFAIDIGHVDVPDFADHRNVHVTITLKTHANPKLVELIKSIRPGYRCAFCKMVLRNTFIRQDYNAYLPAKYGPLFENQGFVSEDYMKYVHPLEEYKTDGPTGEEPPKDERGKRAETFLQSQGRVDKGRDNKPVYGAQDDFGGVSGGYRRNSQTGNSSEQTGRDTGAPDDYGRDSNAGYDNNRDVADTKNGVYAEDDAIRDDDTGGNAGKDSSYIRQGNTAEDAGTPVYHAQGAQANGQNRANGNTAQRKPANMAGVNTPWQTVARPRPRPASVSVPVMSGNNPPNSGQINFDSVGTAGNGNIVINGVSLTPEQFALIQQMAAQSADTQTDDTSGVPGSYDELTPDSIDESAAPAEEPKLAGDSSLMDMFNNI